MKRNLLIYLTVALFPIYSLFGEITKVGTTAAQFLKIGIGARASAMGESFVAEANDVSALYWNPAGIAFLKTNEVIFVRTNWIADIRYDFVGAAIPLGQLGTFGLFYAGLTMNEMKVRTEFEPDGTGELFTANSLAIGFSFARRMTDRFTFGINGKYIREQIWHESASTVAVDVGILYQTTFKNLRLGMSVSNYGGKMQMDGKDLLTFVDVYPNVEGNNENIIAKLNTEKFDIPMNFRIGFAYDPVKNDWQRFTVTLDGVSPNDFKEYLNVGFEYSFREMVFLRGGYKGIGVPDNEVGFSAGAGLYKQFFNGFSIRIDYAYTDFGRLENVQRFSIILGF
ncbi:MAG: UPF0164 family protein [Calditrichaeota bacterium]|nr:UPF0164 family protein [Calditrichota bacterium]